MSKKYSAIVIFFDKEIEWIRFFKLNAIFIVISNLLLESNENVE